MSEAPRGGTVDQLADPRTEPSTDQVDDPAHRGTLDVRAAAIGHLAEHVASDVPGTVRYRSNMDKLRGRGYPHAEVNIRGASSWITLDIAVSWPAAVEDIAQATRDQVRTETARLSGSDVRRVDVTVHLLSPDQGDAPQRRVQ
ncbi:Asp23/Gls24 family envelope stress response protein [Allobranchiibius sp. GilTou73]|uniref:Asp23/Gls24 family envelope stress response protein n=1 Tax=Allobranchiibius sp. GilTou73 TaxID=2904523 RepID=UPI001F2BF830|nr:Asp23/Gls24 family envelope stress response protein [Allobranchiibius sp. GilTou73]UIJ35608.1 Asp23/Gls24 family envelope stress response protein [Allobranchiibius sp. GilTou73]